MSTEFRASNPRKRTKKAPPKKPKKTKAKSPSTKRKRPRARAVRTRKKKIILRRKKRAAPPRRRKKIVRRKRVEKRKRLAVITRKRKRVKPSPSRKRKKVVPEKKLKPKKKRVKKKKKVVKRRPVTEEAEPEQRRLERYTQFGNVYFYVEGQSMDFVLNLVRLLFANGVKRIRFIRKVPVSPKYPKGIASTNWRADLARLSFGQLGGWVGSMFVPGVDEILYVVVLENELPAGLFD